MSDAIAEIQSLAREAKQAENELIAAQRDMENLRTQQTEVKTELAARDLSPETLDAKIEELQGTVASLTAQARKLLHRSPSMDECLEGS